MHVLVLTDMEGISRITRYQEIIPVWPEYWERGRGMMTDDVLAAVEGLFEGGATRVTVHDGHGSGARNIIEERMPPGVPVVGFAEHDELIKSGDIDATFQVGRHARRGTNSFASHTFVPYFAAAFDGQPITETHWEAYRSGVPLLGVTGDESLAEQIDQGIAGTPYLVVKHSRGRGESVPAYPTAEESLAAIRGFARACARDIGARTAPRIATPFTFAAAMPADVASQAVGREGLVADGPTVVTKVIQDWWRDFEPAFLAAVFAGYPGLDHIPEADPDMKAKVDAAPPERIEMARKQTTDWIEADETTWG
jgi:D-amino peptidase